MIFVIFFCLISLDLISGENHTKEIFNTPVQNTGKQFLNWLPIGWIQSTSAIPKTTGTQRRRTSRKTTSVFSTFTRFQYEALEQTNAYRRAHCAPSLVLNSTLNSIAQNYANKLALYQNLVHSDNGYGENLYYINSLGNNCDSIKGSEPVRFWYKEIENYNWASPRFSQSTGHFTQLVWITTKQFGIGIARTANLNECYIVANYWPPGNSFGEYEINVKNGSPCI